MTLDQLKILDQIVEHGSMRGAAKALFRTQPTLSVAMKNLEQEFGLVLFSREQHRITLTLEGQAIYQKAKRVLGSADALQNLAKQLAMGNEPQVNIAFDGSIPIRLIAEVLNCLLYTSDAADD